MISHEEYHNRIVFKMLTFIMLERQSFKNVIISKQSLRVTIPKTSCNIILVSNCSNIQWGIGGNTTSPLIFHLYQLFGDIPSKNQILGKCNTWNTPNKHNPREKTIADIHLISHHHYISTLFRWSNF